MLNTFLIGLTVQLWLTAGLLTAEMYWVQSVIAVLTNLVTRPGNVLSLQTGEFCVATLTD